MAIALRLEGYNVLEAATAGDALEHIWREPISVALVDLLMAEDRGDSLLAAVAKVNPEARLFSLSTISGVSSSTAASGRAIALEKPVSSTKLVDLLARPTPFALGRRIATPVPAPTENLLGGRL